MLLRRIILFLLLNTTVFAQEYLQDARSIAVSNSFVAARQPTGVPTNLAALIHQKKSFIEVTGINKYSITELNTVSAVFSKKINSNNSLLFAVSKTGNNSFSEQTAEAGISKQLMTRLSTGLKIKYNQWVLNDARYERRFAFIPEISLLVNALSNLNLGVVVRNPVRSRMGATEIKRLPAEIISGASATVSNKIKFSLSTITATELPAALLAGIEYEYVSQFTLRAGYRSYPPSHSFGCEFSLPRYNAALSIQTHQQLGISSAISLTFRL